MSDKTYSWGNIDSKENPKEIAVFLDTVTAMGEIQRYKQKTYQLLKVGQGSHILDLGCGVGDDAFALAKMVGSEGLVIGVDNSSSLIEEARQRVEDKTLPVEFRVDDAQQLDFQDSFFDGCRADRIFMHLPDRQKALSEMIRVTRPGGWVVATDPDWDTLIIETPDKSLTRKILNTVADDISINSWSGRELYKLFFESELEEAAIADTFTLVLTDFATANQIYFIEKTVYTMQSEGVISPKEAELWLGYLQQADREGVFFSATTGFTVVGQRR